MSFVDGALDKITGLFSHRPSGSYGMNRVDAASNLLQHHPPWAHSKVPPPPTQYLPTRTCITVVPFSDLGLAQTHAYYEEIQIIPALAVNQDSAFSTGHWWLVHPVTCVDVLSLSSHVLLDLQQWIEKTVPISSFTSGAKQVLNFKNARGEMLENVNRKLERRIARDDVAREEGYMGPWEVRNMAGKLENGEKEAQKKRRLEEKAEKDEKRKIRHLPAHLEEAAEAGGARRRGSEDEGRVWVFALSGGV